VRNLLHLSNQPSRPNSTHG